MSNACSRVCIGRPICVVCGRGVEGKWSVTTSLSGMVIYITFREVVLGLLLPAIRNAGFSQGPLSLS